MPEQTSKLSERFQLLLNVELIQQIDNWRFANHIASRGEAIRRLIVLGLKAAGSTSGPSSAA
jgi:hypothetical protein